MFLLLPTLITLLLLPPSGNSDHPLRPPLMIQQPDSSHIVEEDEIGIDIEKLKLWTDLIGKKEKEEADSVKVSQTLTESDFAEVAKELGVEVASIKAVVEIEAGVSHKGFCGPNLPIINFDLTMFRQFARRNGVDLSKFAKSHEIVFSRPQVSRYGSQQLAQHARLEKALSIDKTTAIQGTFWGMFQIGGFNWAKCGAKDIDEFVYLMSRSERDQLNMFAKFITNSGLLNSLKNRNWDTFARGYNGSSYARRGYHTKLASAYAKYKNQSKK